MGDCSHLVHDGHQMACYGALFHCHFGALHKYGSAFFCFSHFFLNNDNLAIHQERMNLRSCSAASDFVHAA